MTTEKAPGARLDSSTPRATTNPQETSEKGRFMFAQTTSARDVYAPSRARLQARAALTRGRRAKKPGQHTGEIPGQLSIDDALAEIAAEQAAEQAAEGGERS